MVSYNKCLRCEIMSNEQLASTKPPTRYPITKLKEGTKLLPVELNWKILKKAMDDTSKHYLSGECPESTYKTYHHTYGINNIGCDKVISHCKTLMAKKEADELNQSNVTTNIILKQAKNNPSLFNL